jgi:hypothetical protein
VDPDCPLPPIPAVTPQPLKNHPVPKKRRTAVHRERAPRIGTALHWSLSGPQERLGEASTYIFTCWGLKPGFSGRFLHHCSNGTEFLRKTYATLAASIYVGQKFALHEISCTGTDGRNSPEHFPVLVSSANDASESGIYLLLRERLKTVVSSDFQPHSIRTKTLRRVSGKLAGSILHDTAIW